MILFQILFTIAAVSLALIGYLSGDWIKLTTNTPLFPVVINFGLKNAVIELSKTGTTVTNTNWCEINDELSKYVVIVKPESNEESLCSIIKNQIEPSIILGVVFVCGGCIFSLLTKNTQDTYPLGVGRIVIYLASLICFAIAVGRWNVVTDNVCGDNTEDTCYNSTDYWLLVAALVASLTLTLEQALHLLDKIFSVPFGKAHTSSVPSRDRQAHPVDPSSAKKEAEVNARV